MKNLYILLRFIQRDLRHIRMIGCMVANDMSFIDHTPHQLRFFFDIIQCYKKHSRDLLFLQRIQDRRGVAVFVPFVKGQAYAVLIRQKYGAVPSILFLQIHTGRRTIFVIRLTSWPPYDLFG